MSDRETLSVYARKAGDYVELTQGVAEKDPLLKRFLKDLPKGGHILDLGCGPGSYARVMATAGFKVTAVDAVPEMIEISNAFPGVEARVASFDEIDDKDRFDGIWANFSLLHAPRADMPKHLAALNRALRPGGLFHIALKSGDGEKRDSLGRRYAYFEMAELESLLEDAGFTVVHRESGREKGLDGTPADWIALQAHG
ncbi:MAG: class I SAM-dependent methyltransferase [Sulfitobacter sp.]|nr:class I SAM-dependent methyltransferase [Sulfitobacter sp.]